MSKLDSKFITQLQGKDFVTYEGLLDLAHQEGLMSLTTEIIQFPSKENNNQCIMKAIAKTKDREFHGYGDADNGNVNSMIKKHLIRMAETRAKARALRDLTNVGMTAAEELGGEDSQSRDKPKTTANPKKYNDKDGNENKSTNSNLASDKQLGFIYKLVKDKDYGADSISKYIKSAYDKESSKELTKQEASELIEMLSAL